MSSAPPPGASRQLYGDMADPTGLLQMLERSDSSEVVVAGDWHSNRSWAMRSFDRIASGASDARIVLHLGDFNLGSGPYPEAFLNQVNASCVARSIEAFLITPGNHDDWIRLATHEDWRAGLPAQLHERVWVLPRGYRFAIGGRDFLSFGGAASLDRLDRVPGSDWSPDEVASPEVFDLVAAQGSAHVMLTHEAVDGATAVTAFIEAGRNPSRWPPQTLLESAYSRSLTTGLWNAVSPPVLFHGHMHEKGIGVMDDGRRVYAVASDERAGNLGSLRLGDLDWRFLGAAS